MSLAYPLGKPNSFKQSNMTSSKTYADLKDTVNEDACDGKHKIKSEHDKKQNVYDKKPNDNVTEHPRETDYEINGLSELRRQCDTLKEQCYGMLGSCDLTDLHETPSSKRFSNSSANGMIFYGSETSINTVISNPCSDASSQHTQNSSECSNSSLNSTMDNSFDSSETSYSTDAEEQKKSDDVPENDDMIDVKWDILRDADRRKKKTSKSSGSDKSSSTTSRNSDKSSVMHLNVNIRKLLSKLKHKSHEKKTKIKKSKGSSISSNSDDSGSITTTVYSASHVEWYTNLFKDCISSDSSDSEDDNPNSHKVKKKTNIRGKISLDFEMHKQKITDNGKDRNDGDKNCKQSETNVASSKNTLEVKTKGSYANIRKTNTVELQKGTFKNNRRKCIQSEHQKNNFNNIDSILRSCEENNNKNENALCRNDIDMQKNPLISRYSSYTTCCDDINTTLRTRPAVHYERRSYSTHEDQYRSSVHEQHSEFPKMIASFDFIASEDLEVTVLTGQQVEILVKPDQDWWYVRTHEGKEGFVPKNFLNVIPTVPSRKSDLIKKLMSLTYNPDIDIFDKPDHKPDNRNQVRLPTRIKFSESPRLAKVAPLMREAKSDNNECIPYKFQNDSYCIMKQNGVKRLPPPSYSEHINNTLAEMIEKYCDTLDTDTSTTRSCHSEESDDEKLKISPTPRVLRRRSFSGNKQKKVHFSNKIATAYLKDSPEYNVSDRYGLDSTACNSEADAVSYC